MKLLSIVTLSSVMAFSVFSHAQANDWKSYAGANCLPSTENADMYRSAISGDYANMGNRSATVFCPVVRDISAGGNDRVYRARVRLTDANNVSSGYCKFFSRNISGNTFDSQIVYFSGTGDKTLTFGPLNASNWGSYLITCRIPGAYNGKKSYIRSYSVEESS